jgi:hypothetical protein
MLRNSSFIINPRAYKLSTIRAQATKGQGEGATSIVDLSLGPAYNKFISLCLCLHTLPDQQLADMTIIIEIYLYYVHP